MHCRCIETDAELQRCLSALRQVVDVVPDTRKCRRSSDGFVRAHEHTIKSVEEVSQTTEPNENTTLTRSQSIPSQHDVVNFDIRDYLIDRCVTDTSRTAADADDADNADNYDDISSGDKTDKRPSSVVVDSRRSSNSSLTLPSQRFSDSELTKCSYSPTGSATLPARAASTAGGADTRAKRHRWKLFRKALNLFSLDEPTGGAAADDDYGQSDGGTGQDDVQQPRRLDVRSISVESLPGQVPATHQIIITISVIHTLWLVAINPLDNVSACGKRTSFSIVLTSTAQILAART